MAKLLRLSLAWLIGLAAICSAPPAGAWPLILRAGRYADDAADAARAAVAASRAAKLRAMRRASAANPAAGSERFRTLALVLDDTPYLLDAAGRQWRLAGSRDAAGRFRFGRSDHRLLHDATLILDQTDLRSLHLPEISHLLRSHLRHASIIDEAENIKSLRPFRSGERTTLGIEAHPNLFVALTDAGVEESLRFATQRLLRHELRVISLFHHLDAEISRSLGEALGELHRPFHATDPEELLAAIRAKRRSTHVIVGHVEGDRFVVRSPSGEITASYDIAAIEEASRRVDGSVLFLGCGAAGAGRVSGFVSCVRSAEVTDALRYAVRAPNIGEFLETIAARSGPMLIWPDFTSARRIRFDVQQIRGEDVPVMAPFATVKGATPSRARVEDLDWRLIPIIPWYWPVLYGFGLALLLIRPRMNWAEWKDLWWDAPDPALRRIGNRAAKATRAGAFLLLSPWMQIYSLVVRLGSVIGTLVLLFLAPLAVLSVALPWIRYVDADRARRSAELPEGEPRPQGGRATALITTLIGYAYYFGWDLLIGAPEMWHFFSSLNAAAFTILSILLPLTLVWIVIDALKSGRVSPLAIQHLILLLPMLVARAIVDRLHAKGRQLWAN